MTIQPIVEGHGEIQAIPVLLRRILQEQIGCYCSKIAPPMKLPRSKMIQSVPLSSMLRMASCVQNCGLILVIFDADDDCPAELNANFRAALEDVQPQIECEVIAISREYECWFLASMESLRSKRGIAANAVSETSPEIVRGAKEKISEFMPRGRPYVETSDQPALTALLDLEVVIEKCDAFRRLLTKIKFHHTNCNCQCASISEAD